MKISLLALFPSLLSICSRTKNAQLCWLFQLHLIILKWALYLTLERDRDLIKDLNETFPHYLISVFLSRVPKRKAFELGKIYYL